MPLRTGVRMEDVTVEYERAGYPIRPLDKFNAEVEPGTLALALAGLALLGLLTGRQKKGSLPARFAE